MSNRIQYQSPPPTIRLIHIHTKQVTHFDIRVSKQKSIHLDQSYVKVANAAFQSAMNHAKLKQIVCQMCNIMCCTSVKKFVAIEAISRKRGNIEKQPLQLSASTGLWPFVCHFVWTIYTSRAGLSKGIYHTPNDVKIRRWRVKSKTCPPDRRVKKIRSCAKL